LLPGPPASNTDAEIEQVRAVVHGGRAVVGPRGNVAVRRTTVVRPGWHGGGARWARPGRYRRPVGGTIAAGSAIGFVTAGAAPARAAAVAARR
jgi:hypothetical protein